MSLKTRNPLLATLSILLLAGVVIAPIGCESNNSVENAAEKTGDALEDAADATGDAINDAVDATEDAVETAGDNVEDATDK